MEVLLKRIKLCSRRMGIVTWSAGQVVGLLGNHVKREIMSLAEILQTALASLLCGMTEGGYRRA
jgi:hypothetical protein